MGSVTERVLHASKLPLLIVPPQDTLEKGYRTQDKTTMTEVDA